MGATMDKVQQMGAERPQERDEKPLQRTAQAPRPSQQAGGASTSGQMQSTQFTDWASI